MISKWGKQVLSVLLAVVLVGGVLPMVSVPASAAVGYGSTGKFLASIDPPIAGSIPISTRAQLEAIKNNLNANYYLTRDIDLAGAEWVPIGTSSAPFGGYFDGQGYVIKNLKITGGTYEYNGLFGYAYSNDIKNVGLEGTDINVTRASLSDYSIYAGGICGSNASISNCYNTGDVSGSGAIAYVGGICGWNRGTIENCYNTGEVVASVVYPVSYGQCARAGGIFGFGTTLDFVNANNCFNSGKVSAVASRTSRYEWLVEACAGGIGGYGGTQEYCYNTGVVNATATSTDIDRGHASAHVGGIQGYGTGANYCYNIGTISAENICTSLPETYVGGISGQGRGPASNCYNMGALSASVSPASVEHPNYYPCVGGIFGYDKWDGGPTSNCYNVGGIAISGAPSSYAGGISGYSSCIVNNSYALDLYSSDKGRKLSSDQMKQKASFEGWDFNTIWDVSPSVNNGYPFLRSVPIDDGSSIPPPSVLVNKSIFFATETNNKFASVPIDFSDRLFNNGASTYSHDLALAGSVLSASAYIKEHINEGLGQLEFEHIEQSNYAPDGSRDQVAYSFGVKQITCNGKRYNLFAIIVRGTVGKDWYSNFNLGRGNTHAGFLASFEDLYRKNTACNFVDYAEDIMSRSEYSSNENKIFVTGHSRGAAVANLVAAELTSSQEFALKDHIYAYTFATPNVTKDSEAKNTAKYSNIWNFVNPEDFVPYMPCSVDGWNYWKYGTTIAFESWSGKAIANLNTKFRGITGNSFSDYSFAWHGAVQNLVKNLHKVAKTSNDFYDNEPLVVSLGRYYSLDSFFYDMASYLSGDLKKSDISDILKKLATSWHYGAIARFFIANSGIGDNVIYAHARETYIAWVQSTDATIQFSTNISGRYARIACPVDVEVYDDTSLVGRITSNTVDESLPSNLSLTTIDDEKYIYLPPGTNYLLKLTGTDTGRMDYTIEELDILTMQTSAAKSFTNVALTADKMMMSTVGGSTAVPNVQLLVTNSTGTPIASVSTDGSETPLNNPDKPVKGIFGTNAKWYGAWWHYLLFFFCFGFIWMWF